MKNIGFIGVGIMGKSMVRNLMKNGFQVSVYARTRSKVEDVIGEGAQWCETIEDCAKNKDAVITIVGYPKDVEEVYFSQGNIMDSATKGTYLIDMTTTSPELSVKIYQESLKRGLHAMDAPVTGGDTGAKNGTLAILVGGDEDSFHVCFPIFQAMGSNIVYEGAAGSGQHTKMANQIMIAGSISGVCEALTYAKQAGLDLQKMFDSVKTGAASSAQLTGMCPRILANDLNPGFFLKHFIKDMKIAEEEAEKRGISLKMLDTVLGMYEEMEQKGMGELGTQALIKYYES